MAKTTAKLSGKRQNAGSRAVLGSSHAFIGKCEFKIIPVYCGQCL
jgi:hypothetical protein